MNALVIKAELLSSIVEKRKWKGGDLASLSILVIKRNLHTSWMEVSVPKTHQGKQPTKHVKDPRELNRDIKTKLTQTDLGFLSLGTRWRHSITIYYAVLPLLYAQTYAKLPQIPTLRQAFYSHVFYCLYYAPLLASSLLRESPFKTYNKCMNTSNPYPCPT